MLDLQYMYRLLSDWLKCELHKRPLSLFIVAFWWKKMKTGFSWGPAMSCRTWASNDLVLVEGLYSLEKD